MAWPLFGIAREAGLASEPNWFGPVFQNMCAVAASHPEHVGSIVRNLGMLEDADTLMPLYVDAGRTRTYYQMSECLGLGRAINPSVEALQACLDAVKPATMGSSLLKLTLEVNPAEAVEDWLTQDGTAAAIQRIPEPRRSAIIASFKHMINGYPVSNAMRPEISRILKDCGDTGLKSLMEMVREWEFDENCADYETWRNAAYWENISPRTYCGMIRKTPPSCALESPRSIATGSTPPRINASLTGRH